MSRFKIEIANKILNHVKEARGYETDADLAHAWGRNASTIATWRKNGSIGLEPLVEHEGDLNFNWLFFDDPPVWRDQIKEDGEVIMFREPSQKYGEKSTEERIEELEIPAKQKLKLLDAYIKTLEELKTENRK